MTEDIYYYYEVSHYRPVAGDLMLTRMLDGADASEDGFGFLVDCDNVEEHLVRQKEQAERWINRHAEPF